MYTMSSPTLLTIFLGLCCCGFVQAQFYSITLRNEYKGGVRYTCEVRDLQDKVSAVLGRQSLLPLNQQKTIFSFRQPQAKVEGVLCEFWQANTNKYTEGVVWGDKFGNADKSEVAGKPLKSFTRITNEGINVNGKIYIWTG